mmetsp:Transcript_3356/g.10092  ORF Transcript_3356/g.10092 Transcript_3356/m.10092 type:complete len:201 (-) Transcript_3356:280-882(-)
MGCDWPRPARIPRRLSRERSTAWRRGARPPPVRRRRRVLASRPPCPSRRSSAARAPVPSATRSPPSPKIQALADPRNEAWPRRKRWQAPLRRVPRRPLRHSGPPGVPRSRPRLRRHGCSRLPRQWVPRRRRAPSKRLTFFRRRRPTRWTCRSTTLGGRSRRRGSRQILESESSSSLDARGPRASKSLGLGLPLRQQRWAN